VALTGGMGCDRIWTILRVIGEERHDEQGDQRRSGGFAVRQHDSRGGVQAGAGLEGARGGLAERGARQGVRRQARDPARVCRHQEDAGDGRTRSDRDRDPQPSALPSGVRRGGGGEARGVREAAVSERGGGRRDDLGVCEGQGEADVRGSKGSSTRGRSGGSTWSSRARSTTDLTRRTSGTWSGAAAA
jgi:hypothetical protein